jgi:reactive intermediate/imine deaminase
MANLFSNPPGLPTPIANGYSQVAIVELAGGARMLFVSGQVPIDSEGRLVGAGDMRRQAEQVFENLRTALQAHQARFSDVVKANFFVTDMSKRAEVVEVRQRYFATPPPASSFFQVARLVDEAWLLEIEIIAVTHGTSPTG